MISGLFLATSLAVIATPGPDAALAAQLVFRTGSWRPAAAAAVGMIAAGACHAAAALTGVSLLLRTVPAVFTALVWAGAAFLALLGIRALCAAARRPRTPDDAGPPGPFRTDPPRSAWRCVGLGLLSTGSNPKVGLFFLAYLPQFLPTGGAPGPGIVVLAAVYLGLAALWLCLLITVAYRLHGWLAGRGPARSARRGAGRAVEALAGAVFIALAVRLVWQG
ncbi:LysE family translocator [Streptomyces sp. NPDC056149]|uniref:LysE family translocator n=1 Tax=Streptomyces sp. NPDC056149 TaxID=3345728 RepID=UPI0035D6A982